MGEQLVRPHSGKVAVIGAGTMGPGIALVFAANGHDVALCDKRPAALERARRVLDAALAVMVAKGTLSPEAAATVPSRIHPTASLAEAGADAELVVEAVYENKHAKKAVFETLDGACPETAIFASNTSYLNIFDVTPRPRRTVIAHWFAPPHLLPLVEVVRGPLTDEDTVSTIVGYLESAGKLPIVLRKFVPGFAVNRLQRAIGREVLFLLQNGYVSPEDLDLAVKASLAPRMMLLGVVQRYDFAGLDLTVTNLANEGYEEAPVDRAPEALLRLVREGNFGVKSGKGFYDYGDRALEDVLRARDEGLLDILEHAKPYLTPSMPLGDAPEASPPSTDDSGKNQN